MKIEYGRLIYWLKSLIFQAKKAVHHDKWMADGYVYLHDVIKGHYDPALVEEIKKIRDTTSYINHQIEDDWDGKEQLRLKMIKLRESEQRIHAGRPPVKGKTDMYDEEARTFDEVEDKLARLGYFGGSCGTVHHKAHGKLKSPENVAIGYKNKQKENDDKDS